MKTARKQSEQPGIAFEKVVAAIQAQIDPASIVTHNEIIKDRLGQSRQFDVVVRGNFAGQPMLGVIECKDLEKKVGTPEVDGFVTKAQDVNANFKILMSRRGFSKPALKKCAHYGIQALSLIDNDPINKKFFIGMRWEADITRWGQISITLHFAREPRQPVYFAVQDLTIRGKQIVDWFYNYLLDFAGNISELGWVVNKTVEFRAPQSIAISAEEEYLCTGITFMANRVCDQYERFVGISGTGFFDWNSKRATFPPGTTFLSDQVPMDFTQWQPRNARTHQPTGFLEVRLSGISVQFERVNNAIDLEQL